MVERLAGVPVRGRRILQQLVNDVFERVVFSFKIPKSLLDCLYGSDHSSASCKVSFRSLFQAIKVSFVAVQAPLKIGVFLLEDSKA